MLYSSSESVEERLDCTRWAIFQYIKILNHKYLFAYHFNATTIYPLSPGSTSLVPWAGNLSSGVLLMLSQPRRAFKIVYAALQASSLASCFVALEAVATSSSPSVFCCEIATAGVTRVTTHTFARYFPQCSRADCSIRQFIIQFLLLKVYKFHELI